MKPAISTTEEEEVTKPNGKYDCDVMRRELSNTVALVCSGSPKPIVTEIIKVIQLSEANAKRNNHGTERESGGQTAWTESGRGRDREKESVGEKYK